MNKYSIIFMLSTIVFSILFFFEKQRKNVRTQYESIEKELPKTKHIKIKPKISKYQKESHKTIPTYTQDTKPYKTKATYTQDIVSPAEIDIMLANRDLESIYFGEEIRQLDPLLLIRLSLEKKEEEKFLKMLGCVQSYKFYHSYFSKKSLNETLLKYDKDILNLLGDKTKIYLNYFEKKHQYRFVWSLMQNLKHGLRIYKPRIQHRMEYYISDRREVSKIVYGFLDVDQQDELAEILFNNRKENFNGVKLNEKDRYDKTISEFNIFNDDIRSALDVVLNEWNYLLP